MAKLTLTDPANFNSTTLSQIASNHNLIEAALENTLSRDGTSPNQMTADLDLNNNDLLNVATAGISILNLDGTRVYPNTIVTVPILDEDDFVSNSAVHAPSQQSAKAYVDNSITTLKAATNTWTGVQTITTSSSGTTILKLESTSADGTGGPQLDLLRNSASPAANDVIGILRARGMNSSAVEVTYANINTTILDPTAGSEDARIIFQVPVAGAQTSAVSIANGMIVGAPTGSYKGTGTINATGYYENDLALKAVNVDGGFTFATTTTSIDIAGIFGGTWKSAHRAHSIDTATFAGSRATSAILREATGSGTNGPSRADYALHVEVEKTNWLTSTVLGEVDGMFVNVRQGENGDCGAILINSKKVQGAANYGSVGIEMTLDLCDSAEVSTRTIRTMVGGHIPSTDIRRDGLGFQTQVTVGTARSGYLAYDNGGSWVRPFVAASDIAAGTEYFYVTGPADAAGAGRVVGQGSAAFPAFSFIGDTDTGVGRPGADQVGLYTNGTARLWATTTNINTSLAPRIFNSTAIPAGGQNGLGYLATSATNFGVFFGSGAPTLSAAKGSLYLRSDGTTTNNRAYINTDGGTTWTALTTAA